MGNEQITWQGFEMRRNTTPIVDAIGAIHFEGNIVPASWYQNIRTKDDKSDLVAITILAEIVYWYRPEIKRDENTGEIVCVTKRFGADMLQRGYESFAEQFSLSKEQARDACHRLRDAGLITIEIRHGVHYGDKKNMVANNVVFIAPIPSSIAEITYRYFPNDTRKASKGGVQKQARGGSNVDTNTQTTTQTNNISDPLDITQEQQEQDALGDDDTHAANEFESLPSASGRTNEELVQLQGQGKTSLVEARESLQQTLAKAGTNAALADPFADKSKFVEAALALMPALCEEAGINSKTRPLFLKQAQTLWDSRPRYADDSLVSPQTILNDLAAMVTQRANLKKPQFIYNHLTLAYAKLTRGQTIAANPITREQASAAPQVQKSAVDFLNSL